MELPQLLKFREQTSQTICLAKFHEATIWLYNGKIASCHHTPTIPLGNTLADFYNPEEKRKQQSEMLEGKKPDACNYCWNLEKQNLTSDRQFKSLGFKSSLSPETYFDKTYNFKPKALELAFQNTCNLACSYCSPVFSTEWINDIKKFGVYENIQTDWKKHYSRGLDNNKPVDMDLFWTWFDTVINDLESLRVTGGEPLLHNETFITIDKITKTNPDIEFVMATNLTQKPLVIDRFIDSVKHLNKARINISNESAGEVAEFIRDGIIYSEWLNNVRKLLVNTTAQLSVSTTITALSLISLDEMFVDIMNLREECNNKLYPYISINIATYPEFQSIQCLTLEERNFYHKKYVNFFEKNKHRLVERETRVINRLIKLLEPELLNEKQQEYRKDFETFFAQYCVRRNKNRNVLDLLGKK